MMTDRRTVRRKRCLLAALAFSVLSLVFFTVSFTRISQAGPEAGQENLVSLKKRAGRIRREFAGVLARFAERREGFAGTALPGRPADWFSRFQRLRLNPETEGIGLVDASGRLTLWLGNAVDLIDSIPLEKAQDFKARGISFLIKNKASFFLVFLRDLGPETCIAHFRLLAFIPQFQSPYVRERHFLPPDLLRNCLVDYWDFAEDLEAFEKIFARNNDEYAGKPVKGEVQTLFFPLRNEAGRIMATATLSSASPALRLTAFREDMRLAGHGLLVAAFIALLAWLAASFRAGAFGRMPATALAVGLISGLRTLFIPISRLGRVSSLDIFSPASAGIMTPGALAGSPADIFLTALWLSLIAAAAAFSIPRLYKGAAGNPHPLFGLLLPWAGAGAALALITAFQALLRDIVFNSNVPLLRVSLKASFLLLHAALFLFLAGLLVALMIVLRAVVLSSKSFLYALTALAGTFAAFVLFIRPTTPPAVLVAEAAVLCGTLAACFFPAALRKKEAVFGLFVLALLYLFLALDSDGLQKSRNIVQRFVRNTIQSHELWARFFLEQSLPEVDRSAKSLLAYMANPGSPDLARTLWEKTLMSKFNWYSSLEIQDSGGNILSRFSLNIPRVYVEALDFPPSRSWVVRRRIASFLGKETDFLVAYKDWYGQEEFLGRTIFHLSLAPETLPFLYSANPYFDLLHPGAIPSLNPLDLGIAIFSPDGRLLFNPQKLSSGLPSRTADRLARGQGAFWDNFRDKGKSYNAFYFRGGGRVYALFLPVPKLKTSAASFLKVFFFDLLLATLLTLLRILTSGRARLGSPFRSFSVRVYAAFLAAALIPLLFFTVFTRNLFDRLFADKFIDEAAVHAGFARSIMEDFIFIQEQEGQPSSAPSEDLVHWISATLASDVNLFRDGALVASSRREFFDAGLLPELLDGEVYFQILYENKPFAIQPTRLGSYSFQTVTIPYSFGSSVFFISLPFPFEKQETAVATRELVEFLILLSLFFAVLVLVFARALRSMVIIPIRKLLAGTREVGLGNLEVVVDYHSRDEMMDLVEGFNAMIKNLKAREQELAEMSKKVAWAEMARKVAHEIKNPLTPIQLSAEHLLRVYEDKRSDFAQALKESASYIISEVENLRKIAQEFMEIARDTAPAEGIFDLRDVLTETLRPYEKLLAERVRFRVVFAGDEFHCRGDAAKIKTALRNILINAIESIPGKGVVEVRAAREGRLVSIIVRDTGPGMSKATLERIFEPYFSTKDAGTGLGLPIAKKIIEEHGGSVRVDSKPGRGTEVSIELPCGA